MRKSASELPTSACGAGNIERYLNNERIRRAIRPKLSEFMAVGATGSEALNAEIKKRLGGIVLLRAPILKMKLRIFHLAKLNAFCSARFNQTTYQIRQNCVLARNIRKKKICLKRTDWIKWCSEESIHAISRKRPQMVERDVYASRYAAWKKSEQKGVKKVTKKLKRTPYRQNKGRRSRWMGKLRKPEP